MIALFPGQGSQHVGMGRSLYDDFSIVREVFEEASDSLSLNLKKLCFDGPESDLTLTENTQPCLLTTSVATFRAAQKELGLDPEVAAGHSLGEYSALVAADCLSLSSAVRWVRDRGRAMQIAVPEGKGGMAAVMGLDDDQVDELCKKTNEIVEPANYNAPGQVVIAGSTEGIAAAETLAADIKGVKFVRLNVSAPFHCSLMKPAREAMVQVFAKAQLNEKPKPLRCSYIPNRTGRKSNEPGIVFDLLIEQIDHPVLWTQTITHLIENDWDHAIEFGPGKVLQGLGKRIARPLKKSFDVLSVGDTDQFGRIDSWLKTKNQ